MSKSRVKPPELSCLTLYVYSQTLCLTTMSLRRLMLSMSSVAATTARSPNWTPPLEKRTSSSQSSNPSFKPSRHNVKHLRYPSKKTKDTKINSPQCSIRLATRPHKYKLNNWKSKLSKVTTGLCRPGSKKKEKRFKLNSRTNKVYYCAIPERSKK